MNHAVCFVPGWGRRFARLGPLGLVVLAGGLGCSEGDVVMTMPGPGMSGGGAMGAPMGPQGPGPEGPQGRPTPGGAGPGPGGAPPITGGGGPGPGNEGGGGVPMASFCARWKALGPGALPGFATDSACADYSDIPTGDVPCSGAGNAGATISEVLIGQNHLLPPSSEDYTRNEAGTITISGSAARPKFRLVSHRPALLKVGVTGAGDAPEVKVTATRNGMPLGSLCLKGPPALPASVSPRPSLADSFTVQLPAAWIRSGLALQIQAGGASRTIPPGELRVGGGIRQLVVEMAAVMYGIATPPRVPQYMPRMADELPVQSLVWSHFPVPMVFDPFVMSARGGRPDRILLTREGGFDEVGECLSIGATIRAANGQTQEAAYFVALDRGGWNGGLGGGGNASAGPASQLMIRHETGHTYGLPHLEDAYGRSQYPFAKRTDGSGCILGTPNEDGCGVGPYWKYFQYFGVVPSQHETASFASPWDPSTPDGPSAGRPGLYVRDPMAGGGNNWFGAYTVQWVLDFFQDRVYWDDLQESYVKYNPGTGEFAPDTTTRNGGYYDRPVRRDVPVYTLFGGSSATAPEARVIQPPMHYRGNLLRTLDPSKEADLAAAAPVCRAGCNFTVRVTFDGALSRTYLINSGTTGYLRWAINVADEGKVTKVELFRRPFDGTGATAATFLDTAVLQTARDF